MCRTCPKSYFAHRWLLPALSPTLKIKAGIEFSCMIFITAENEVWENYSQTELTSDRIPFYSTFCTRIILPDVDDYDSRLSILKLEDLGIHLDILCLRYVSKVRSNEDHVCYNLISLANKTGRTTFSDNILFKLFT